MSTLGTRVYIGPRPRWLFGIFPRFWRTEPLPRVSLVDLAKALQTMPPIVLDTAEWLTTPDVKWFEAPKETPK